MARFEKAVRKYLADRAEPETGLIDRLEGRWDHVLVVPLRRERVDVLTGIEEAAGTGSGRVLVILVVNGEAGDVTTAGRRVATRSAMNGLDRA